MVTPTRPPVRADVAAIPSWVLLVDGRSIGVPVENAAGGAARRRGLLGRGGVDGVLVLGPCRQVHTIGMRFAIDVAFCAGDGRVLRVTTMRSGRISRVVWRARFVLEAGAGRFASWGVEPGVRVEVREHATHESRRRPRARRHTDRQPG